MTVLSFPKKRRKKLTFKLHSVYQIDINPLDVLPLPTRHFCPLRRPPLLAAIVEVGVLTVGEEVGVSVEKRKVVSTKSKKKSVGS